MRGEQVERAPGKVSVTFEKLQTFEFVLVRFRPYFIQVSWGSGDFGIPSRVLAFSPQKDFDVA